MVLVIPMYSGCAWPALGYAMRSNSTEKLVLIGYRNSTIFAFLPTPLPFAPEALCMFLLVPTPHVTAKWNQRLCPCGGGAELDLYVNVAVFGCRHLSGERAGSAAPRGGLNKRGYAAAKAPVAMNPEAVTRR